jgi:hypothetical protein
VDEGHTLPTRLLEELRQLTNIPTPMPAVHIVLGGTSELEEILGNPKMESFAQRIGARHYLEPLDHSETVAYLRTQMKAAGLEWDAVFEPGADDAVFSATDGVPRLVNQLSDHALVMVAENCRARVTPADIAAAWAEIQRLPPPAALAHGSAGAHAPASDFHAAHDGIEMADELARGFGDDMAAEFGSDAGVVEFGSFGDEAAIEQEVGAAEAAVFERDMRAAAAADPWQGPEVELVFDAAADPFEEYFEQEERVVERYVMRGPEDFSTHRHVASREGTAMARQLDACELVGQASACQNPAPTPARHASSTMSPTPAAATVVASEPDDSDMVVIEEDILEHPSEVHRKSIFTVRPGDYRSLFARLRRGDR